MNSSINDKLDSREILLIIFFSLIKKKVIQSMEIVFTLDFSILDLLDR